MLQTPLCRAMGIEFPIFSVGMSWLAGPELAAAVSNAGGCGVVGMAGMSGEQVYPRIQQARAQTNKPFGVNVILARLQEGQIEACLDERVPLIVFFKGDPTPYVAPAHRRGTKVFVQVGSVEEAQAAAARHGACTPPRCPPPSPASPALPARRRSGLLAPRRSRGGRSRTPRR